MMPSRIPRAGNPMTDAELVDMLAQMWTINTLHLVITHSPEQIGHAIVAITDVPPGRIQEAADIVAEQCPGGYQVHHLRGTRLITTPGGPR